MSTIYHVILEDDDVGEVEGFYRDGELLASWCANDARWRSEYMNIFINSLGYEIETAPYDSDLYDRLKKEWIN